jgi:uncharacterized membrane protein YdjX (TVP38/TMEM64 family)
MLQELLSLIEKLPLAGLLAAQVVLPLAGVPVSPLWIATGVRAGVLWGALLSAAALAANLTLGYWLARKWLRRPIEAWLRARGKVVPQIPETEETLWILLLRVTPGVPLFVQNYLLGLAQVRFDRYLAISFPAQLAYAVAFVALGQALKDSNVWRGMLAVSGLVAVAVAVLLIRRHLDRKLRPPVQE